MLKVNIALLILFVTTSSFAQINTLEKPVSIAFNNITLEEALHLMENEAGISLAYNSNLTALKSKITNEYHNRSAKFILNDLLKNEDLGYKIIGNKVTIYALKKRNNFTISGYVYDAETGEVLIGCNIYDKVEHAGTSSNQYGFYSLTLPLDVKNKSIVFSYIGYQNQEIQLGSNTTKLNITLIPERNQLDTMVVTIEKGNEKLVSSEMSKVEVRVEQIKAIPAIGGEADVLRAITLLPGIKQGADGSSGFYVRGGGPDQNLILLDGVPIYHPYHLWGFLSTFNADAINNVEVTKGAFPARYGGRLSSVLDITMKEGNNQKWQTGIAIGLLSAKVSVSGPLIKDKSSMQFTARRTYADLIMVPILKSINSTEDYSVKESYNFTDLNLKYNYKISDNDRIYFSGLFSNDKYKLKEDYKLETSGISTSAQIKRSLGWGNLIGSFRWNHLLGDRMFVNTTAYLSAYKYSTSDLSKRTSTEPSIIEDKKSSIEYLSNVIDLAIKQDYEFFPSEEHSIKFGVGGIYHAFKPGINSFYSEPGGTTIDNRTGNKEINSTELSAYFEDDFELSGKLRLNLGVHMSGFLVQGTEYYSFQPRSSLSFNINKYLSIKASYAQMTQYLHLLTTSGITHSSDLWVPATKNVKPQRSEQVSLGTAIALGKGYHLEIEGYYKSMDDIIDYKDGASFLNTDTGWEDKVVSGKGNAYGGEVFLNKTIGQFTGWLGYTLSWSNRIFEDINFGETYPDSYDRRHDISLVGTYKINKNWSLNGTWVYYTGNPATLPTSTYITPDFNNLPYTINAFPEPNIANSIDYSDLGIVESVPQRNNFRLPNYHRLDITAAYNKKKSWGEWQLIFGLINVYNKSNASFYYIKYERDEVTGEIQVGYYKRTLFPIMPTISYRVLF